MATTSTFIDPNAVEYDEYGNPKPRKPATALPTQNPNDPGANVTLSSDAMGGAANWNTTTGNEAVLGKAQQDVLRQPQTSELQGATTQAALDWVKSPMGTYDPAKAKQAALEKSNQDWANAFESMRQQYGNVSGSGLLQKEMLSNALAHNVDQQTLGAQMDQDAYNKYVDSLGRSLAAGQSVNESNENIFSQRLGNLGTVRGMAEGERGQVFQAGESALDRSQALLLQGNDIQGQKDLATLQGRIRSGELLQTQDFQATQAALDRAQQAALQSNDIQAQKDIATLRADLDKQAAEAQRTWQTAERTATQTWQSGERVSSEDADKAAQYFDAQQRLLLQKNDFEGQAVLATLKNQFDLNMQTQDMKHDERMLYLQSQYDDAKANNDVTRQKDILSFTYKQDIAKMQAEFGFDTAKMKLQGSIDEALRKGDYLHAEAMQKALFDQQSLESAKDRILEEARIALQAKGVDLQAADQQYTLLEKLVQAGNLNPSVLTDFVGNVTKSAGVTMTPPDPLAAQKEADKEFAALQSEYLRTHPEYVGADGKINEEGRIGFNEFVNKSMYGEAAMGTEEALTEKATEAINDPAKYDALLKDPSVKEWVPEATYDDRGFFLPDERKFSNPPAKGSIIKYGGKVYQVMSDNAMDTKGENTDTFTVMDLKDGTTRRIYITGEGSHDLSIMGF